MHSWRFGPPARERPLRGNRRPRRRSALAAEFKAAQDDYSVTMVPALGDGIAEALAAYFHKQARDFSGYSRTEKLTLDQIIHEKYRGVRPAPGCPACPDHTQKPQLWRPMGIEAAIGIKLTES